MEQVFSGAANPKYRLDFEDFVKTRDGAKLYRIIALRDFGEVEKGQKGGYIEGEHNLSQSGNCWVAGLAHVRKQARVEKNALVCDFVEVTDEALLTDDTQASGHAHIGGFARMEDESMAEDHTRIKALEHSVFFNLVRDCTRNPLFEWETTFGSHEVACGEANDEEIIQLIDAALGLTVQPSTASDLRTFKKQLSSGCIEPNDRTYDVALCKRLLSKSLIVTRQSRRSERLSHMRQSTR